MAGYVVALIGLPGAGKSTVARSLRERLDLHEVNRDVVRAAMFPQCAYSDSEKRAAVDAVMIAVEANCRLSRNSIVDGMTFADAGTLRRLRKNCARHDFTVVALWLDCPVAEAQRRVRADHDAGVHLAADRGVDLVSRVAARFDQPPADVIRLDATAPAAAVCAAAAQALDFFSAS